MQSSPDYDVIILGAGAAGLMCAATAAQRGKHVLLIDKADKVGKKILISGGGRCNFTNINTHPSCFLSQNPHFCKSALARYTPWDFMALMEKHDLSWHEKTLGQLFCDQKSKAVVAMLWQECVDSGVGLQLQTQVQQIHRQDGRFHLQVNQTTIKTTSLVIATGGPSIPKMGSTDIGLQIAKQFGLKSIPFSPALVPFTFLQSDLDGILADLSGISTEVEVSCQDGSFREKMLFTHRGLSGPAMLQISSYWQKGLVISIDLLPGGNSFAWLKERQKDRPQAELKTILNELFPKRLAQRLCEQLLPNRAMAAFSEKELQQLADQLHNWEMTPAGTEGMRTAEVALGGVDTQELSSKTMEARKVPGLYFIGETVDVTGWLGGYNFQWAWASGWCAGQFA
ncbi:MAG: NAD(P)/FAD-dependent oxidoreductase [Thiolinea sp.]